MTRSLFEQICMNMFLKTIPLIRKILRDSGFSKSQIHDVVLVGGSSRIPKIM